MVGGADIARPPHEPLDTLERLILLRVASASLRVTGVINPRGPSLLCSAVAYRALGSRVNKLTILSDVILYLLEVDLDPVHGVVIDEVGHVAEGLGLLQGVGHIADGASAAGHSPPARLDLKLVNAPKPGGILK